MEPEKILHVHVRPMIFWTFLDISGPWPFDLKFQSFIRAGKGLFSSRGTTSLLRQRDRSVGICWLGPDTNAWGGWKYHVMQLGI